VNPFRLAWRLVTLPSRTWDHICEEWQWTLADIAAEWDDYPPLEEEDEAA
jgi:hypothetical protein